MTEAQQTVYTLRGLIASLPAVVQARVKEAYDKISATVDEYGEEGRAALGLLGAEKSAEEETGSNNR